MKKIGTALLSLASVGSASAYFQVDIENHARWVVLDDMPLLANGQQILPEVTHLWTNDIVTQPALISAVCGTLDSHNTDDGLVNFAVFYSVNDDGKVAMVGRPFLYGRVSARNLDAQYEAASEICRPSTETPVVADTGSALGTAVSVQSGVAAETEAAALAKRD
jgi:hypothetical protein